MAKRQREAAQAQAAKNERLVERLKPVLDRTHLSGRVALALASSVDGDAVVSALKTGWPKGQKKAVKNIESSSLLTYPGSHPAKAANVAKTLAKFRSDYGGGGLLVVNFRAASLPVDAESVSFQTRAQEVISYAPQPNNPNILAIFHDVQGARRSFSPVVRSLYDAYAGLTTEHFIMNSSEQVHRTDPTPPWDPRVNRWPETL